MAYISRRTSTSQIDDLFRSFLSLFFSFFYNQQRSLFDQTQPFIPSGHSSSARSTFILSNRLLRGPSNLSTQRIHHPVLSYIEFSELPFIPSLQPASQPRDSRVHTKTCPKLPSTSLNPTAPQLPSTFPGREAQPGLLLFRFQPSLDGREDRRYQETAQVY
ncbi:hypothetical protein LX36DRAFT_156051 [Colletotrichum falcatum]|nr:hypothetical protein LX36DRAFT_156051 [Colletotrichum falcatum]